MPAPSGFTLIETCTALAVAAVLGAFVIPSFSDGIHASRAMQTRSALLDSVRLAVNRSALTGNHAVLCPSADGQRCNKSPDWSAGWLVFVDSNQSRELDGDERVAMRAGSQPEGVRLVSTVGRTRIVFQGNGGNAGSNVSFTLCDGRGPAQATALILNNQGRLRETRPSVATATAICQP